MDVNLVFVSGRLAVPADLEQLPDGSRRARLLVCVRSERRSRFDVLRVIVPPDVWSDSLARARGGAQVWVAGHLMRRYSQDPWEPTGLIEVIAAALTFPDHQGLDGQEASDAGAPFPSMAGSKPEVGSPEPSDVSDRTSMSKTEPDLGRVLRS